MSASRSLSPKIIPVILCGGNGTRLWPISRERAPKQLQAIIGDKTLLIQTLERAQECAGCSFSDIICVTTKTIEKETTHQLTEFHPEAAQHVLSEPCAKNTAAAIAYTALYARKNFDDNAILWIMPADHHIENQQGLKDIIQRAAECATDNHIVTFGMKPTRPDTGYGYIKTGSKISEDGFAQAVDEFIEKPDAKTTEEYLQSGDYLWNSGMFVGAVDTFLNHFKNHCADIITSLENSSDLEKTYYSLPAVSFDHAVMEKTQKAAVIPCDIGWNDIGCWNSVYDLKDKDSNSNVIEGHVSTVGTESCLIQSKSKLIATLGVKDLIIIENHDSILIANRHSTTSLKELVSVSRQTSPEEFVSPPEENRPWGRFKILSESKGYKVKELTVEPGKNLSSQMHHHRSEFWTVISGQATVTIDGKQQTLKPQESVFVPKQTQHCLKNKSQEPLIIVEIQSGDYLGEDDIVRLDENSRNIEAA